MRADGHMVSDSTVERAMRRRGSLLPTGFRADHKTMARVGRQVFVEPVTHRIRVWQMDFSEFETLGGGIWRLCAVVDYASKYACPRHSRSAGSSVQTASPGAWPAAASTAVSKAHASTASGGNRRT